VQPQRRAAGAGPGGGRSSPRAGLGSGRLRGFVPRGGGRRAGAAAPAAPPPGPGATAPRGRGGGGGGGGAGTGCRRRCARARGESEQRFSTAFYSSPAGMAISRFADGRFMYVNDQFVAFFGYARSEAIGKTSAELGLWADPGARDTRWHQLIERGGVHDVEIE